MNRAMTSLPVPDSPCRHVVASVAATWVARFSGVTLVPDRANDGTNVACVPADAGFRFAYGPGSFARHRAEARRLDLPLRVVREPSLGWDVDVPADLTSVVRP